MIRLKHLSFLGLFPLVLSCNKAEPVLPGDLGRINDAVLAPCKPYNFTQTHTCVFFADEFNGRIRVYDATDRQFVLAPIAYAPLTLSDKSSPAALASDPKYPYLFALDSANAKISVFRTMNAVQQGIPFGEHLTQLTLTEGTEFGATAISVIPHPDQPGILLLMVAVRSSSDVPADPNRLVVFSFDTATATQVAGSSSFDFLLPAAPNNIATLTPADGNTLIAVSQDTSDIALLNVRDLLKQDISKTLHLPADGATGLLTLTPVVENTQTNIHVFALRKNVVQPIVYEVIDAPISTADTTAAKPFAGKRVVVDGLPLALFAPGPTTDSCCLNTIPQWIVVATERGVLQYISVPAMEKIPVNKGGATNLVLGRNLGVNAVHPVTMVGGPIIPPDANTQNTITGNQPRQLWGNQIFIGFDAGSVGSFKYGQIEVQNLETLNQG